MGGFVYFRKNPAARLPRETPTLEDADFALYLFGKRFVQSAQLVGLANGDFIAATGTLFYQGRMGEQALRALHADFGGPADLFSDLCGSFAVLLRKNGVLYCFNDYFGNYHLYSDARGRVVSSSFLSVLQTQERIEPEPMALYEYVFDGSIYGNDTLARGVRRLDAAHVHCLHPGGASFAKTCRAFQAELPASFDDQVDAANAELFDYFRMLRANFDDGVVLGLSGGYDSRLLLAAALAAGLRPGLFAGGAAASADVRIARDIAEAVGLPFEQHDSAAVPASAPQRFAALVEEKLSYYDSAGLRGAINDGEEYFSRQRRLAGRRLELNGGGGEIYRDFWKIPNRRIGVQEFVVKTLDFKASDKIAAATARFDRRVYRESLAHKLKAALQTNADTMNGEQVASLYTLLRSTCFAAPTNKELNLLACSLLPFAEPRLAVPSWRIPLAHKIYGRFESEMIRRLSPRLARHPSSYGHRFCDPLPMRKRMRETFDRHVRNVLPLPLIFAAHRRLRKKNEYNSSPGYYADRYLRELFGTSDLCIAEYFDLPRLRSLDDPHVYSRALTVELLLRGYARPFFGLTVAPADPAALPRAA